MDQSKRQEVNAVVLEGLGVLIEQPNDKTLTVGGLTIRGHAILTDVIGVLKAAYPQAGVSYDPREGTIMVEGDLSLA